MLLLLAGAGCFSVPQPAGWAPATVAGDRVYVASQQGKVVALDATTLAQQWSFPPGQESLQAVYAAPVAAGSLLYVAGFNAKVYALEPSKGEGRWEFTVDGPVLGSPALEGERLLVGTEQGSLYALDAQRGEMLWHTPGVAKAAIWSDLMVHQGFVYFGSLDHRVYAVDVSSGALRWSFETRGGIAATPLVVGNTLYVGSFDGRFYALSADAGQERWRFERAQNWFWGKADIFEDTVYAGALDGRLYALDAATGVLRWSTSVGGPGAIGAPPVVTPELVLLGTEDGRVLALDRATGSQRWVFRAQNGAPVRAPLKLVGDRVYVTAADYLYALESRTGQTRTQVRVTP